jgi:hypothetical protein
VTPITRHPRAPSHLTPFGAWLWDCVPRWRCDSVRAYAVSRQRVIGLASYRAGVWLGLVVDAYSGVQPFEPWRCCRVTIYARLGWLRLAVAHLRTRQAMRGLRA